VIAAAETSMRQQIKEIRDRHRANLKHAGQSSERLTPGMRLALVYVATMLASFTIAWTFYLLM